MDGIQPEENSLEPERTENDREDQVVCEQCSALKSITIMAKKVISQQKTENQLLKQVNNELLEDLNLICKKLYDDLLQN